MTSFSPMIDGEDEFVDPFIDKFLEFYTEIQNGDFIKNISLLKGDDFSDF